MGYSTPKKQLDLKDFLSQPAKPRAKRTFGYRPQAASPDAAPQVVTPEAVEAQTDAASPVSAKE